MIVMPAASVVSQDALLDVSAPPVLNAGDWRLLSDVSSCV